MRINYNNLPPQCLMYSRCFLAQYICPRLNTFYAFSKYCVLAIFLCICHAQTVNAQTIVGPCGSSITITNASSPTATDGKYVVSGLTADAVYVRLGIVGSEMIFEAFNVTNTSCVASGLGVGTYTVRIYTETGGIATCANVTQLVTIGSTSLAACAGTEIGGTVFHDANANGINDVGEQGQAGITINAYNSAGTLAATQTSATNGVYRFTGLTTGQPYRLEYAWGDGYLKSGAAGTGSGTSIQFVNAGSCVANFGVNFPPNYCQTNNPYVMTPCYINGDPTASAVAPLDVMVAFPYRAASFDFGLTNRNVAPTHVASASQMGATWAVAYQKTSKYAFAGATMRRFAGFGPLGTGGIYKINMTIPTAPVVSNWIDAKVIGIPTGNDTRNATVVNRLATAPGTPAYDAEAFNQVGKVGIGGMDFNERGDTLWLVNLADKRLYGIKNVNPATTPVAADLIAGQAISLPAGYSYVTNANDFRPWAVKYYKGLVYVGAVCSAESTPWNSANLKGYVLSFNPANPAAGFSVVAEYPLNIVRQGYSTSLGSNYPWVANTTTPNLCHSTDGT
jgi:SdrD B-like domain